MASSSVNNRSEGSLGGRLEARRAGRGLVVLALLLGVVAWRLATVYSESINWDEFALLRRAADSCRTGVLRGGGRPGLVVTLLIPLVCGCADVVETVRLARILWIPITGAYLAGFFVMLVKVRRGPTRSGVEAALLGLGLLGLVPVFLRWSLQVRTDQVALALGMWAGVALMASRRHVGWAALAGALFAAGFAASQKLVYVAALGLVLAAGQQFVRREFDVRRELCRSALVAVAAVAVWVGYRAAVALLFPGPARLPSVSGVGNVFAFYRETLGWRVYHGMWPTLVPHMILGIGLAATTVAVAFRPRRHGRELVVAWGVMALGVAVAVFHAGAFPYFWMTVGLFPAAAAAMAWPAMAGRLGTKRARKLGYTGLWMVLLFPSVRAAAALLEDTQAVQRASLAFVDRNFSPSDCGFHPEGALLCREDPKPLPVFFTQNIRFRFERPGGEQEIARFLAAFETRPVQFIITSYRLRQFPDRVREFWRQRYVQYGPAVWIPGRRVSGPKGTQTEFWVIVEGEYRWVLPLGHLPVPLIVDGRALEPDAVIFLERGAHLLELGGLAKRGRFAYSVAEPRPSAEEGFYSLPMLAEYAGWPP